jgi:hypothetical protein
MSFTSYAFVGNYLDVPDPVYYDKFNEKKTVHLVATSQDRAALVALLKEKTQDDALFEKPDLFLYSI